MHLPHTRFSLGQSVSQASAVAHQQMPLRNTHAKRLQKLLGVFLKALLMTCYGCPHKGWWESLKLLSFMTKHHLWTSSHPSKGRPRISLHVLLWRLYYFHPDLKTQHDQTHFLLLCVNTDLKLHALIASYLFLHDALFRFSYLIYYFFWWLFWFCSAAIRKRYPFKTRHSQFRFHHSTVPLIKAWGKQC